MGYFFTSKGREEQREGRRMGREEKEKGNGRGGEGNCLTNVKLLPTIIEIFRPCPLNIYLYRNHICLLSYTVNLAIFYLITLM